jgi:hypothetical protein
MERACSTHRILVENLKVRDNSEDLGIDEEVILERLLRKWDGKMWTGFFWARIGIGGGLS